MLEQMQTSESRTKATKTRNKSQTMRKRYRIPARSKAIRKKCLECVCGSAPEVNLCQISNCPLWPYRFGRNPRPDDLKVPECDEYGKHVGYREYEGWETNYPWGPGDSE